MDRKRRNKDETEERGTDRVISNETKNAVIEKYEKKIRDVEKGSCDPPQWRNTWSLILCSHVHT